MNKTKTVLLALLTMLLWGSLFPMVKLGFSAYSVVSTADILLFAGIRFVICGAVICVFSAVRDGKSYRTLKGSVVPVLLSGLFAIILHYAFTYLGLELTASSKTALIKQIGALLYVCFSFVFIKQDRPTVQKIVAAAVGFLGIAVLNISSDGFTFAIGDVLILCASFCTVFANVISKRVFAKVPPVTATGVSQLFGGAVLLAVGLARGGRVELAFDPSIWIMVYICTASIVSYCIWYGIVKDGELSRLFIIKFAEPVFACIFGAIILNENIWQIQYLAAFVLVSGAVWFSNIKFKKSHKISNNGEEK